MPAHALNFCYLLLLPYEPQMESGVPTKAPPPPRDAPYFFELDFDFRTLATEKIYFEDVEITIKPQVLDNQVWVGQCEYSLGNSLSETQIAKKVLINAYIRKYLLAKLKYQGNLVEEYSIVLARGIKAAPEAFIQKNRLTLARLLRSTDRPIATAQAKFILKSRVVYSAKDVTVVDWEGALVIIDQGDFQSDIDLLMIGNYQLIRYRMLDEDIESDLRSLRQVLKKQGFRWLRQSQRTLYTIVQNRLQLLLDFEWTNQALLLIGDWYSAQLYRTIVDEFYIKDWKDTVDAKLNSLSEADEVMRNNLSFSWSRVLDIVQIAGWLILLIGYFVLFFIDLQKGK